MKLKMIISILLVSVFVPVVCTAEVNAVMSGIPISDQIIQIEDSVVTPCSQSEDYPVEDSSVCYVPVTYKTVIDGVVTNEVTYYEKVADIDYKFYVTVNSLNKCTGGSIVASKGIPTVTAVSASHLDLSVKRTEYPTGYVIPTNNGDGYSANIYGGCVTITYNAVIYKDITNQIVGVESTTVTRAFSYTKTGTVAALLQ